MVPLENYIYVSLRPLWYLVGTWYLATKPLISMMRNILANCGCTETFPLYLQPNI